MAESSSRRAHRKRKEKKRAKTPAVELSASPPSYSVEENSEGEWVNSRLNVKWPEPAEAGDIVKHRYCDPSSESAPRKGERKRRSRRSKREKRRDQTDNSARSSSSKKEAQYIQLSIGSSEGDESQQSLRRERKRMVVQTSPQVSRKSHSGFRSDEGGQKVDSIVFDTRSELMRYKQNEDILPSKRRGGGGSGGRRRTKKPSAADQRENEEYNRYYVGVRSRRGVEAKLKCPGEFALYYEKPAEGEVPATVPLKIAYLSSSSQAFHFVVQCFEHADGHSHYVVMQNKSDGKMFTSILALVKHYSLYSHVDTITGRLETFSVPH